MEILGLLIIGTGFFVILGAKTIVKAVNKRYTNTYNALLGIEDAKERKNAKEEEKLMEINNKEIKALTKKAMNILYVVGIVCIMLGILMILFR